MFRTLAIATVLAASLVRASAARAQLAPDDTGAGVERGMTARSNSGQVGDVTLFRRGPHATLVVVTLFSAEGRTEPAHVHRGRSCAAFDAIPAFGLAPVVNGTSKTIVEAAESRLLSGNYVVDVRASAANPKRSVSCGLLFGEPGGATGAPAPQP